MLTQVNIADIENLYNEFSQCVDEGHVMYSFEVGNDVLEDMHFLELVRFLYELHQLVGFKEEIRISNARNRP